MERRDKQMDPKRRRELGAHYTPYELAKRVTATALQPLLCWPVATQCPLCPPSEAILNLLVIDPACGDGVFLNAAADLMAPLLDDAYVLEGLPPDPDLARKQFIENCLIGIDIDPGAIAAAEKKLPGCELICADALLDWDLDTAGRPTAFIGNPPFLGGRRISTVHGKKYQARLLNEYPPANGGADLCAYFFLLAAHILSTGGSKGTYSFIATNTISQGKTREAGLAFLLQQFGAWIYAADTDTPWPGDAAVMTSTVHLANKALAWELWPDGMLERAIAFPSAWPDRTARTDAPVTLRRRPPRPLPQQGVLFG